MRLFVAVWPPADVVGVLAALDRPDRAGVRWTTPDQWHVTLRFLGDVTDADPVVAALEAASLPPAGATLGQAVRRLGRHVAAVPVRGLDDLAAAVVAATAAFGRPPDERPFRGHVTIARSKPTAPDGFAELIGTPLAAQWPVDAIGLVRSRLHPQGARYETLASFPVPAPHRP